MEKGIAEIRNVIDSKYIEEKKTGAWKAQINELGDGKYLVEVYWFPYYNECNKGEYLYKLFNGEKEAQKLYDVLTFNNMKELLNKGD